MRIAVRLLMACVVLGSAVFGQQAPPTSQFADLQEVVNKQFGPDFILVTSFPSYEPRDAGKPFMISPLVTGDFDGDGVADAVIVATSKNPLVGQEAFHYKVVDPYDAYFGWSDPRVTLNFGAQDPSRRRYLLVIHGAGAEGWRSATPKAKFVIINLPFDRLTTSQMTLKKKAISAINAEEAGGMVSVVFWDGKKYRWEASGFNEM